MIFTIVGKNLKIGEIETAFSCLNVCPRCCSREGFWLGLKRDKAYVQCKGCGTKFELFEIYAMSKKGEASKKFKFFRKLFTF